MAALDWIMSRRMQKSLEPNRVCQLIQLFLLTVNELEAIIGFDVRIESVPQGELH